MIVLRTFRCIEETKLQDGVKRFLVPLNKIKKGVQSREILNLGESFFLVRNVNYMSIFQIFELQTYVSRVASHFWTKIVLDLGRQNFNN